MGGAFRSVATPKAAVRQATNPNLLWLRTPRALKIHMPINVKDIKRYKERPDHLGGPTEVMPEAIVVDGQDCYEVEDFFFFFFLIIGGALA